MAAVLHWQNRIKCYGEMNLQLLDNTKAGGVHIV